MASRDENNPLNDDTSINNGSLEDNDVESSLPDDITGDDINNILSGESSLDDYMGAEDTPVESDDLYEDYSNKLADDLVSPKEENDIIGNDINDNEQNDYLSGSAQELEDNDKFDDNIDSSLSDDEYDNHGTYWSDNDDFDDYQSIDRVAPDEPAINTGFPVYDPTAIDYNDDIYNTASSIDNVEESTGMSTLTKVLAALLALLGILFTSWIIWWLLSGKDNNQFLPWQETNNSANTLITNENNNYDVDSLLDNTSSTTPTTTNDLSAPATPEADRAVLASLEKQVEDLERQNQSLESDLNRANDRANEKETMTNTETRTETRTDTVTAPPRVETRTNTVTNTITNNVTAPAPPPVTERITLPRVTNTVTSVTRVNVPGPRVVVTTTVYRWVQ